MGLRNRERLLDARRDCWDCCWGVLGFGTDDLSAAAPSLVPTRWQRRVLRGPLAMAAPAPSAGNGRSVAALLDDTPVDLAAALTAFWSEQQHAAARSTGADALDLPQARIKRIMKSEDVKMLAAESSMLMAHAVELFVQDIVIR